MTTLADKLTQAVEHHKTGDLARAESLYREILRIDSDHADALHLLGVASHQQGVNDRAVEYISRAVALNSRSAMYHSNLGVAYRGLGQFSRAEFEFRAAIALASTDANLHYNLGNVLNDQEQFGEAVACFRRCLEINPNHADAHNNLGNALKGIGRLGEGIAHHQQALRLRPQFPEAHFNLGNSYRAAGDLLAAVASYQQAIEQRTDYAEAWVNLGSTYKDLGALDKAKEGYHRALDVRPDYTEARFNLGAVLKEQDRDEDALECFARTLDVRPKSAETHNAVGSVLQRLRRLDDAESHYRQALELDPQSAEGHNNFATLFQERRQLDKAEACYNRALAIRPDYAEARLNRSLVYLLRGEFSRGWIEYESRWEHDPHRRSFCEPVWDGTSLAEKTILVYAEQGVGDEILFASCLPEVLVQADQCLLECDPRLVPLFARSFPAATVLSRPFENVVNPASSRPQFDVQIAIGSLPRYLRPNTASFPHLERYLQPDEFRRADWCARFAEIGSGKKIGISWCGGRKATDRRMRSTLLEQWVSLLSMPDCRFVNLQYGDCREELATIGRSHGVMIHDWSDTDPLRNLDDFAAQIAALDLVISVDNATVHMAGALGIPTWVLLPFAPDWRWMLDRNDSLWYPSVRLLRQSQPGRWDDVFERVQTALSPH